MSLAPDRIPSMRLVPGDPVLLVIPGENRPGGPAAAPAVPVTVRATVVDVRTNEDDNTTLLNVAVPNRDGPRVAAQAAEGNIVVTLSSGN